MNERNYVPEGMLAKNTENTMYLCSRKGLETAMHQGKILESTAVLCDCQTMQLQVDLGEVKGIMEREESVWSPDGSPVRDIAIITRVGKPVQFKIKSFRHNERGETIAILSRKDAQRECFRNYINTLCCGDIIPVRITHLEPFGAFCDIGGGIIALLTVDSISVSRISHPADRFETGEYIMAVVKQIDRDTGRIYLSHRELLGTWEENAACFSPGQTVTGIVRSVEDYGVFVELSPNLAGLAEPTDAVSPGDACSVYIKSIIPERMKIKLVLIDNCGSAEVRPCRYFVDTDRIMHIDKWVYSPRSSKKVIESTFDDDLLDCQTAIER
ncbi:MAG: S1 RNA-binding domain-containing protein [Ruminococcaceae bacterium]|nr:S1 RNA-binding domain-containing protein [Oscillospiraceae bacterium]